MKRCRTCGRRKPLSAFYAHPDMADGHLHSCKECRKAYARSRIGPASRAADRRRYRRSKSRREQIHAQARRWIASNPKGRRAHNIVASAIQRGLLVRGKCEKCGAQKVHAHHDDYRRPLAVRWLCALHHVQAHQEAA